MGKYFCISSYIRKPFLIYDFATAPLWISLYMRKIFFSFLSVWYFITEDQTASLHFQLDWFYFSGFLFMIIQRKIGLILHCQQMFKYKNYTVQYTPIPAETNPDGKGYLFLSFIIRTWEHCQNVHCPPTLPPPYSFFSLGVAFNFLYSFGAG